MTALKVILAVFVGVITDLAWDAVLGGVIDAMLNLISQSPSSLAHLAYILFLVVAQL